MFIIFVFLSIKQNLGGEYEGHDESVEVVDGTLEEDQGSDGSKPFLFTLKHIFSSGAENGFKPKYMYFISFHLHLLLDDSVAEIADKYTHSADCKPQV